MKNFLSFVSATLDALDKFEKVKGDMSPKEREAAVWRKLLIVITWFLLYGWFYVYTGPGREYPNYLEKYGDVTKDVALFWPHFAGLIISLASPILLFRLIAWLFEEKPDKIKKVARRISIYGLKGCAQVLGVYLLIVSINFAANGNFAPVVTTITSITFDSLYSFAFFVVVMATLLVAIYLCILVCREIPNVIKKIKEHIRKSKNKKKNRKK